jgi:MGT family glycosyltransferase
VLARRGHRVVAWAPEGFREQIERDGVVMRANSDGPAPPARLGTGPMDLAALFANVAVAWTPELVDGLHAEGVDVVVNDAQAPWGRVAADWLGLPKACSFPLFPPIRHFDHKPPDESTEAAKASVLASRAAIGHRWGIELGAAAGQGFDMLGAVNLVYATPEVLGQEDADRLDDSWHCVGPLMERDGAGVEPALGEDDGRPLVYVALGSVYGGQQQVFKTALEALAGEPVRVLAATFNHVAPEALAPLPDNATVAARVDSRAVLARAAVHVSHGGANSVHESLLAGVPMVFLPQGSDNPAWATRLTELGVGSTVEESAERIREAVLRMLGDRAVRERTRQLGDRILAHDGADRAVAALEELAA